MMRMAVFCALLILLAPTALFAQTKDDPGTWAFQPARDEFRPDALLDLRSLNEKQAGESGFVKVDADGNFVLGNGKPVRFWAVNTNVGRAKPFVARPLWSGAEPDLAHHARFLAKRGVNMVRLHAHLDPGPKGKLTDFDRDERDWIWRTVAAMRKEGIYATISPFWAEGARVGPSWGIPGVTAEQSAAGLLFFDSTMQEGYRAWLKALYAETNPYTGIPLAADPAVAIIQLQNEDSLLFWTLNNIQGEPRRRLCELFGDFLKSKYGSLDKAKTAWGGADNKEDDFANGIVALDNIWELTQDRSGARARRLDDMTEFLSRTMFDFNRKMEKFLRDELGCKQLINAGNWQTADMVKLNDAERWSYTANEVLAVNRYFDGIHIGRNNGWAIENGDRFTSPSALLDPRQLPVSLKLIKGSPMLVTESAWVMPDSHAGEGPFLVAAYQSLSGVDGYYLVRHRHRRMDSASVGQWLHAVAGKVGVRQPGHAGGFSGGCVDVSHELHPSRRAGGARGAVAGEHLPAAGPDHRGRRRLRSEPQLRKHRPGVVGQGGRQPAGIPGRPGRGRLWRPAPGQQGGRSQAVH